MHDYWYKKNKTQLLRGFCAVIEEGGVLKASRKLNIAQSSVSLQISSLERDLGFQLFVRENQKLIPTEEAKRLYKVCKKVLTEMDMIFTNSKEAIKTDYDNIIRISAHSYMLSHILPPYFKKVIEVNPKVKFELHNSNYEDAMDMLEACIIDFAIFPAKKDNLPKNIIIKEFYKCELGIILSKDHPLSKIPEQEITWNLLSEYDFITLGKGVTAQNANSILKNHNVSSRFTVYGGTWEVCLGIIKEGLSISGADARYSEWHKDVIAKVCPHLVPDYSFQILQNKKSITSKSSEKLIEIMLPA